MGPSWEWSRLGLFVFLLCPAAGYYGRITFSFDRALFILDLFTWLDVLASVFGLGKRECGALPVLFCRVEAARREAVQFGSDLSLIE